MLNWQSRSCIMAGNVLFDVVDKQRILICLAFFSICLINF